MYLFNFAVEDNQICRRYYGKTYSYSTAYFYITILSKLIHLDIDISKLKSGFKAINPFSCKKKPFRISITAYNIGDSKGFSPLWDWGTTVNNQIDFYYDFIKEKNF